MAPTKKTASSAKKATATTKKVATKKTTSKTSTPVSVVKEEKKLTTPSVQNEKKDPNALFQRHERDTWSPEKQIGILSAEITMLQKHLAQHAKDVDAKRSLLKKVARRRSFLKYLKANKLEIYQAVSKKLDMKV